MLNLFVNVVYNILQDGKLDIIRLDYSAPDIGAYLALKWINS